MYVPLNEHEEFEKSILRIYSRAYWGSVRNNVLTREKLIYYSADNEAAMLQRQLESAVRDAAVEASINGKPDVEYLRAAALLALSRREGCDRVVLVSCDSRLLEAARRLTAEVQARFEALTPREVFDLYITPYLASKGT